MRQKDQFFIETLPLRVEEIEPKNQGKTVILNEFLFNKVSDDS